MCGEIQETSEAKQSEKKQKAVSKYIMPQW